MTFQPPSAPDSRALFISHYSAERELALALQQVLRKAFLQLVDVFVASDSGSIRLGSNFVEDIETAILKAKVGLFLLSPRSIDRLWVHIEFGAFWIQRKDAVPILHSGLTLADLPAPYSTRNAMMANDTEALDKLARNLAQQLGMGEPTPDWRPFLDVVAKYDEQQKKIQLNAVAEALHTLNSGLEGISLAMLLRDGRSQFVLLDSEARQIEAVALLEREELVVRREVGQVNGEGGSGRRFTLEGTSKYTRWMQNPDFLAALKALDVPFSQTTEISRSDGATLADEGGLTERAILEKVPRSTAVPAPGDPALTAVRAVIADPVAFHDHLDAEVKPGSRVLLRGIMQIASENPAWEESFRKWFRDTPRLHGQPWFVEVAFTFYTMDLDSKDISARKAFLQELLGSLLRAEHPGKALELLQDLIDRLGRVPTWSDTHWNLLHNMMFLFWQSRDGAQHYRSSRIAEETQEQVLNQLLLVLDRSIDAGNVENVNQIAMAAVYLLRDLQVSAFLLLINHFVQQPIFLGLLNIGTFTELLNAIDQARRGPLDAGEETEDRNRYIDMLALDLLDYIRTEGPPVSADRFQWLVQRAGLKLASDGTLQSRHSSSDLGASSKK